jgi:hypothetical protein
LLPSKIISGGQTGVDRGALDAAIELGLAHGGWCPLGRRAEDGKIPPRYQLSQTDSATYRARTERNVIDSDATLILAHKALRGGTKLTARLAALHGKPCMVVDLDAAHDIEGIRRWLAEHRVATLNVAGPRESQQPGIAEEARRFMIALLSG